MVVCCKTRCTQVFFQPSKRYDNSVPCAGHCFLLMFLGLWVKNISVISKNLHQLWVDRALRNANLERNHILNCRRVSIALGISIILYSYRPCEKVRWSTSIVFLCAKLITRDKEIIIKPCSIVRPFHFGMATLLAVLAVLEVFSAPFVGKHTRSNPPPCLAAGTTGDRHRRLPIHVELWPPKYANCRGRTAANARDGR